MNIHEYQAKQLLAKFGVPISKGIAWKTASASSEPAASGMADSMPGR